MIRQFFSHCRLNGVQFLSHEMLPGVDPGSELTWVDFEAPRRRNPGSFPGEPSACHQVLFDWAVVSFKEKNFQTRQPVYRVCLDDQFSFLAPIFFEIKFWFQQQADSNSCVALIIFHLQAQHVRTATHLYLCWNKPVDPFFRIRMALSIVLWSFSDATTKTGDPFASSNQDGRLGNRGTTFSSVSTVTLPHEAWFTPRQVQQFTFWNPPNSSSGQNIFVSVVFGMTSATLPSCWPARSWILFSFSPAVHGPGGGGGAGGARARVDARAGGAAAQGAARSPQARRGALQKVRRSRRAKDEPLQDTALIRNPHFCEQRCKRVPVTMDMCFCLILHTRVN